MNELIPIRIRKYELVDIPIKSNNLIYCTDTKEAYFDLTDENRIQIGCTIQLESERDRVALVNIELNKIYIVIETNKLYEYHSNQWNEVIARGEVINLLIPATELTPVTLRQAGINVAPKTLASLVYTNDGRPVQNVIDEMLEEERKVVLYTKTEHVIVERDGQRVFSIPFPIANYDLDNYPILLFADIGRDCQTSTKYNVYIQPSNYAISIDQLIFNEDFDTLHEGDLLTFVFHYNVTITEDDVEATTINGVRIYVGPYPPKNPQDTDVWIDTTENAIKQYQPDETWKIIVKQDVKIVIDKSFYNLTEESNRVPIGLENPINKDTDLVLVIENTVFLNEGKEFNISEDGMYIEKIDGNWKEFNEETTFNFIIFRNIISSPLDQLDKLLRINNKSVLNKNIVLESLGLTESEFNKLKMLIKE